jgi:indole-3-glycerol phosphate synthase
MKDILQEIIAHKRIEVEKQKHLIPLEMLELQLSEAEKRPANSMRGALNTSPSGIIAEFKRKSPSKGWIFADAEVEKVLPHYEKGGAAACSVLTDNHFFGGSLDDLLKARQLVSLPLLRKEFIIDSYQLIESRVAGADAILLIASVLSPRECADLARTASELQLEVLLEVHTEKELEHLNAHVSMLGINNRNLGTFETSLDHSYRLAEKFSKMGSNALLISESGISKPATVKDLRLQGFRGFLIGETFMRDGRPGETLVQFIKGISDDN